MTDTAMEIWRQIQKAVHDTPFAGQPSRMERQDQAAAAVIARHIPQGGDGPAPYTCKHGCERDGMMDRIAQLEAERDHYAGLYAERCGDVAKLQADGDKLAGAAEPFVENMAYLDWLEAADGDYVDRPTKSAGDYRRLFQALTEWKDRA